jgi:hypothetical protein
MPTNLDAIRMTDHYTPPASAIQAARSFDLLFAQAPPNALIRGPYHLPANPMQRLNAMFSIPPGYVGVSRHNQRPWAVFEEGRYSMLIFPYRGQSELLLIDTRERSFSIQTKQELSVAALASDGSRFETRIDLDLAVRYCVRNPEITAEHAEPLVELAQHVTKAVGASCKRYEHLNQAEQAGRIILTNMRRHQIELQLGIEILEISVTHLHMLDAPTINPTAQQISASQWDVVTQQVREQILELRALLFIHSHEDTQRQLIEVQGVAHSDRGEQLQIDLVCDKHYPTTPPQLDVQIDGIPQRFPALYTNWKPELRLIDLVQAIIAMHE